MTIGHIATATAILVALYGTGWFLFGKRGDWW